MEIEISELRNGIRIIHQKTNANVAHCGLLVHTGSRSETAEQHGMAHFVEHMFFKGTNKRRAYHILSRMEDVGGELNAYTTKEETCIHTTFFNNYYDRALELIKDIFFDSVFPVKEIGKEKEVVVDEINSYKDSPFEQIIDDFDEVIFPNSALGRPILGTEKSLGTFNQRKIKAFIKENYFTDQIVITSVGKIDFKQFKRYCEKYFSDIPEKRSPNNAKKDNISTYNAVRLEQKKDTYQAHCIMGTPGFSQQDDKRITLHLINNILGGPGLNSRLNLSMREKRGYAYNVESNYTTYSDTGVMAIYFGTDYKDLKKCINLTNKELLKLCNTSMGSAQLQKAKRQLIGQLAIINENSENQMLSNGKSLLVFNRIDTMEEVHEKIQNITASEILEVSNQVLHPDKMSSLVYY